MEVDKFDISRRGINQQSLDDSFIENSYQIVNLTYCAAHPRYVYGNVEDESGYTPVSIGGAPQPKSRQDGDSLVVSFFKSYRYKHQLIGNFITEDIPEDFEPQTPKNIWTFANLERNMQIRDWPIKGNKLEYYFSDIPYAFLFLGYGECGDYGLWEIFYSKKEYDWCLEVPRNIVEGKARVFNRFSHRLSARAERMGVADNVSRLIVLDNRGDIEQNKRVQKSWRKIQKYIKKYMHINYILELQPIANRTNTIF